MHVPLDEQKLVSDLTDNASLSIYMPAFYLHSKATDRLTYLQRPDLGRKLDDVSIDTLKKHSDQTPTPYDLAIVIADGLSSYAINHHAAPFLDALVSQLAQDNKYEWNIAPLCIVHQGRVAVGDDVGESINAKEVLVLIGERPGLSSPDSLGLYMTWNPHRGKEDSLRNCISNVRPEGLPYQSAAHKCFYLLSESRHLKLTGVGLKDRSDDSLLEQKPSAQFFSLTTF